MTCAPYIMRAYGAHTVRQKQAEHHSALLHSSTEPVCLSVSLPLGSRCSPSLLLTHSLQLCLVNSITSTASSLNSLPSLFFCWQGKQKEKKSPSPPASSLPRRPALALVPFTPFLFLPLRDFCSLIMEHNPNQKGLLQSH